MGKGIDFIINSVSIFKGLSAADYSHLETRFDKDSKTILTVNGGITSSIELDGLNKVIGEQEKKDAWEKLTSALGYLVDAGHTVDWGYTQNALESERQMEQFYSPLKATSKIIGLDLGDDLLAAEKTIAKYTRPESTFIYITTLGESTKEDMNEIKKAGGEYLKAFNFDIANAQSMLGILAYNENLAISHEAAIESFVYKMSTAGYSIKRLGAREGLRSIKESASYESCQGWAPWLWGDKTRYKQTSEDKKFAQSNLANWGGLPLGVQIHESDIKTTDTTGIGMVNGYYVAPLLLEMLPNKDIPIHDLLEMLPKDIPFRYRAVVKTQPGFLTSLSKNITPLVDFSKKMLKRNADIRKSFDYIEELTDEKTSSASISISVCTWSKSKKDVIKNITRIKATFQNWGQASLIGEKGDIGEAIISTIPGFSLFTLAPFTLESTKVIASLLPHTRTSSPFKNGYTPLRTLSGKLFPISPTASELVAFVQIFIAGTGAGKSVYQNALNRDGNLKPGNKRLSKTVTLDIGPSGKGTVDSIKASLPENRKYEAIYKKISKTKEDAFNPFDLHLGGNKQTPVDEGFLQDLVEMLATSKNQDLPKNMMPELVRELIAKAYDECFDKELSKIYKEGESFEVDKILREYSESKDDAVWGMRKTWIKVRDYLFERNHTREAILAQRHVVPVLTDLVGVLARSPSIRLRFDDELVGEFRTLMSSAAASYPLLTKPTKVDFDSAQYVVFDLADVTQQQGSQQTGVMYALSAQLGTRDFWLKPDNINCFNEQYHEYIKKKIKNTREGDLTVVFEEYKRTHGLPKVQSMIERWAGEGRKEGIQVQIVMQQPEHASKELFAHATLINLMGTWNAGMITQLKERILITPSEEAALLDGSVHGPTREGSSMIIKYNLKKSGWGSQLVYLTKSVQELWSSSTTAEDMLLREAMEDVIGDTKLSNKILCNRYPKGTAKDRLEEQERINLEMGRGKVNIYEDEVKKAIAGWRLLND
jgi:intracellular multiplication protein IcmB